ncbi:MAG TPA: TadE/TadG family type IV pilus assembly protein, partial [Pyrinomonadaceae bacterium]|nr:TadE/TadG family type IV pilus assembly protein [Pyrinomonadaceae bacterium]
MRKPTKTQQRVRRFLRKERGTQILELAISLPVMLMLLGAVGEFGRFFYTYSALENAVRAGARHACKWERNASWTIPETSKMVVYGDYSDTSNGPILPGLTTSNVVVTANGPSVNNIDSVTVSIVDYQYTPLFDLGAIT